MHDGRIIEGLVNDRVNSAPLIVNSSNPVFGVAAGDAKVPAIRAAMKGRLINGLITNEHLQPSDCWRSIEGMGIVND
jgi:DNA-binding transcriptional regulator LsrR (DeoR family)